MGYVPVILICNVLARHPSVGWDPVLALSSEDEQELDPAWLAPSMALTLAGQLRCSRAIRSRAVSGVTTRSEVLSVTPKARALVVIPSTARDLEVPGAKGPWDKVRR